MIFLIIFLIGLLPTANALDLPAVPEPGLLIFGDVYDSDYEPINTETIRFIIRDNVTGLEKGAFDVYCTAGAFQFNLPFESLFPNPGASSIVIGNDLIPNTTEALDISISAVSKNDGVKIKFTDTGFNNEVEVISIKVTEAPNIIIKRNNLILKRQIIDSEPPAISIYAEIPLIWEQGLPFKAPAATATDNVDGDVTANIKVDTFVDVALPGDMYHVTYTVQDAAGNVATKQIFVSVVDRQLPDRSWVSLVEGSREGDMILATVVQGDEQLTSIECKVPGFWLVAVPYAGGVYTKVELPEIRVGGLGYPGPNGERGWYDFPVESGQPAMGQLEDMLVSSIAQSRISEETYQQLEKNQTKSLTVPEMERLGIDPTGARPGIPMLRGLVYASKNNTKEDIGIELVNVKRANVTLENPLVPAGYAGIDEPGYNAAEFVDQEFYSSFKGRYLADGIQITMPETAGALSVSEIQVPLLEVNSSNEISVAASFIFNIKHLKGTLDYDCDNIDWDSWVFKVLGINGDSIRKALTKRGIAIQASRSAHYLILTPRGYRDELTEFALWKRSKGLNVDFAYVGSEATDDVAADRAAIDDYIENYWRENYCHGVYVLLVGDIDLIPSGRSARIELGPDGDDSDSDHVYEVIGSGRYPSVYVGRFSINSESELINQLAKTLKYERSPVPGDWPQGAVLAANSENFPGKYAGAVNEIASTSYSETINFDVLHAGVASPTEVGAVNQDVIDLIDKGRGHVLYRGHGSNSAWVSGWDATNDNFGLTEINTLSNSINPIVYSISCQNGMLRQSDTVSENWMLAQQTGAVAHFGASANSYTSENHERAKGIFRALFVDGYTRLAPALGRAEYRSMLAHGSGDLWDNNTFAYLLLGDPELSVRKEPVPGIRWDLFTEFTASSLMVSAKTGDGSPVANAFINLALADGTFVNGFANQNGELVFSGIESSELVSLNAQADGFVPVDSVVDSGPKSDVGINYYTLYENELTLHYEGTLESANDLGGPWKVVENASSPFTSSITDNMRFYRVTR